MGFISIPQVVLGKRIRPIHLEECRSSIAGASDSVARLLRNRFIPVNFGHCDDLLTGKSAVTNEIK